VTVALVVFVATTTTASSSSTLIVVVILVIAVVLLSTTSLEVSVSHRIDLFKRLLFHLSFLETIDVTFGVFDLISNLFLGDLGHELSQKVR